MKERQNCSLLIQKYATVESFIVIIKTNDDSSVYASVNRTKIEENRRKYKKKCKKIEENRRKYKRLK